MPVDFNDPREGEFVEHDDDERAPLGIKANGHDPNLVVVPIAQVFPFPLEGSAIPRRPWIIPGFLLRRQVTMLIAPPGSGKSLLTLQVGIAGAAGLENWAGWQLRQQYRVLIINSEEDTDEMNRRLWAAADRMGITHEMIKSQFSFAESSDDIIIAKADARTKTVVRTPMLERIVATIIRDRIDIIVVDPFAETFVGDENSNSEVKWAAVLWREVARRTNAALVLVHHAKKYSNDMAGDMDAARGGGSLSGVARIVCTLFGMTKEEAEAFQKDPDERVRYLRFDDAKANQTLVSAHARWFEKISVTLPNHGDDMPGDDVGVLMPWCPPSVFEDLSTETANAILDQVARGIVDNNMQPTGEFYVLGLTGRRPNDWIGDVIMQRLNCNELKARKLIEVWFLNGVIQTFSSVTPSSRSRVRKNLVRVNPDNRPGRTISETCL